MEIQNVEKRVERARELFHQGYNCCQAVCMAYADLYEVDEQTLIALASSFGGGMGRLREVCGAVSGMTLLAGLEHPANDPHNKQERTVNYALVQKSALAFQQQNGSYICRELLDLPKGVVESPTPSERTTVFYHRRPCADYVASAARIFGESIRQEPKTE